MSWFKRGHKGYGQYSSVMNMSYNYHDIKSVFGEPTHTTSIEPGLMTNAYWDLEILGVKYTIRINSADWARENSMRKLLPVDDVRVKISTIKGDRQVAEFVVFPLIRMMISKQINSFTCVRAIVFVFGTMKDYRS